MTKDEKIWKVLTDYHKEMVEWVSRGYKAKYGTTEITGNAITQLKSLNKVDEGKLVGIMKDAHYLWLENKANTDNILDWYAHEIVKKLEER